MATYNDRLKELETRVEKLEKLIDASVDISPKPVVENFTGPKGGVLLLVKDGFLDIPRSPDEVKAEMESKNFFYKREVIQTALKRLSTSKGLLTALNVSGKKAYVVRR